MSSDSDDIWSSLPPSAKPPPSEPGVPLDLLQRYQRFVHINERRLEQMTGALTQVQRDVFDLIPFLIHQRVPGAPGGREESKAFVGIRDYKANPRVNAALSRMFPRCQMRTWGSLYRPAVRSLIAMGSTGTLAQTRDSDFDLWVIVDDRCSEGDARTGLVMRLADIESWAHKKGLDVHFFPMSAGQVLRRDFGKIQGESAGSALRSMLMEEFYRTHLLLQGQAPLWWLAEPFASTDDYAALPAMLKWEKGIDPEGFIDLGPPEAINADEYLGACLWQMVGSLRRPFKALLKMTLIARHLEQDKPPLLCEMLKERILAMEEPTVLESDPYLILVDTLVDEYDKLGDRDTGRLLRQAFYLKLLSGRADKTKNAEGSTLLRVLADRWGWDASDLIHLERFDRWKVRTIDKMGRAIQIYLERILDKLHTRVGNSVEPSISAEDLYVLDTKIRGGRGQHDNQVELLFSGYYPASLVQPQLIYSYEQGAWSMAISSKDDVLRYGVASLGELLAFTAVNGLFGDWSAIRLEGEGVPAATYVRSRLMRMNNVFGGVRPDDVPVADFGNKPKALKVLIEVFSAPRAELGSRGTLAVSEKWDLLEYGKQGKCLIERIVTWTVTSWGTVLRSEFVGAAGLVQLLHLLLSQSMDGQGPVCKLEPGDFSADSSAGARRVEVLYRRSLEALADGGDEKSGAFVFRAQGAFYLLIRVGRKLLQLGPMDRLSLSEALSGGAVRGRVSVDDASVRLGPLCMAFEEENSEVERLFMAPDEPGVGLVARDSNGAYILSARDASALLVECCLSVLGRPGVIVSRLLRGEDGAWYSEPFEPPVLEPDVWADGDLESGSVSFRVKGFDGQLANSTEEAATWLLSRSGMGKERTPLLALGQVYVNGQEPGLVVRMRYKEILSSTLAQSHAEQVALIRLGRKKPS